MLLALFSPVQASATQAAPSANTVHPAEKKLVIGMSQQEVRGIIGRPAEISPLVVKGVEAEVWTYRRPLGARVRHTSVYSQRVASSWAPGSCQYKYMVKEPVLQLETSTVCEVTELLFFRNELIVAKRHEETTRNTVD